MPTRRIFGLTVIVGVLLWPAKSTVRTWGQRQLVTHQPGEILHGVGEVVVTVL
jgi:hypothetical protein